MMALDDLWILNESGTCMFNRSRSNDFNPFIFSGFFAAITQMGKKCAKKKKNEINDIWQSERQCNFYPRTPIEVSPELFYHFYKLGKGY